MENGIICFKKHFSFSLIKRESFLLYKHEEKRTVEDIADDDSHWIWGMIYYNKNDKHFMMD